MAYNPKIHHKKSIRMKGYDYSTPGAYYLTICAQNRQHLFGEVVDKEMVLNDAGRMVEKWYFELENKYPNIKSREYVIMPNHFHCIIEIMHHKIEPIQWNDDIYEKAQYGPDNKKFDESIFDIMDWFKTMTTNEYIRGVKTKKWKRFYKRVWQKRYWDEIIFTDEDYIRIADYIENNPRKWAMDKFRK